MIRPVAIILGLMLSGLVILLVSAVALDGSGWLTARTPSLALAVLIPFAMANFFNRTASRVVSTTLLVLAFLLDGLLIYLTVAVEGTQYVDMAWLRSPLSVASLLFIWCLWRILPILVLLRRRPEQSLTHDSRGAHCNIPINTRGD